MRLQVEMLKHTLQAVDSASFTVNRVSRDEEFKGMITTTEYDEAIKPLVDTMREEFKKKSPASNVVSETILAGGSARLKS